MNATNDTVHVVTVATESKSYFPYLVESCKRHGGQLEVLGMGEKWEGFNWKYVNDGVFKDDSGK